MQKLIVIVAIAFTFSSFTFITPGSYTEPRFSKRLSAATFEDSTQQLYEHLHLAEAHLDYDVFRLSLIGYHSLKASGSLKNERLISVIDFTKPSTEKRFFTIDLVSKKILFNTYVAHGKNTGENIATSFSNNQDSNQSSLGFYVTGETYVGSKGFSLRLDGQDADYNSNIRLRGVVMHTADYVSETWIKKYGRLGRSQGCPALPKEIYKRVINTIKDGSMVFAYYNDQKFLTSSTHLKYDEIMAKLDASTTVVAP
jgi:hypothetical protein